MNYKLLEDLSFKMLPCVLILMVGGNSIGSQIALNVKSFPCDVKLLQGWREIISGEDFDSLNVKI